MNRFLKGAMILTLAGIIVKIIGAFSKVLLARILGGEGIGLYQMAYPIYQIIVSLATAGLPVAISIMIADKLAYKDVRGASKIFRVSATVLFALGAFSAWHCFWRYRGWLSRNGLQIHAAALRSWPWRRQLW